MVRWSLRAFLCLVTTGALTASALADGGPSPGVREGWDGVLAPAGAVRYVALPARGSTVTAAVRVRDGRVLRFRTLRGRYGVPLVTFDGAAGGLSPDGRTLVLAESRGRRLLRPRSRLALLDTRTLRLTGTVVLDGEFSFDVLSPDGRTLYLIQHVSARDLTRYVLRAYDLEAGRLLGRAVADRRADETTMRGYPLTRVTTRTGRWVYTLYQNPGGHAFVHALDAVGRAAVCIDLPWHGRQERLWQLRLELSADERTVFLRRREGERVAAIDARSFRVTVGRKRR